MRRSTRTLLLPVLAVLHGCSATPASTPRDPADAPLPEKAAPQVASAAPPAPKPAGSGATEGPDASQRCAPIPGLEELSIVGGRPVGVSPEGLLLLDEPGSAPRRAAGWPLRASKPNEDVAPPMSSYDVRGDSLESAVLLVTEKFPDPDVSPPRNEVYRMRGGTWTREAAPPRSRFLDVAAVGAHTVAISWAGRSSPSTLVAVEGGAKAKSRNLVSSPPPSTESCSPGGPSSLAVAPQGLVATIRAGCVGRREWIEIIDPNQGSLGHVPVPEPRGGWVALAWLGGGALLAVVEIPEEPRPRRALYRIDGLSATRFRDVSLDSGSTVSPGADGSVLVTTETEYVVIDATGKQVEPRRWPAALGLRSLGSSAAGRVARGKDGALYVEIRDDTSRVMRCAPPGP